MDYKTIKDVFFYNPETGVVTWRLPVAQRVKVGDIAGWKQKGKEGKTYLRVEYQGANYSVHRLIWLYMTGEWPEHDVDHINGNGVDNRWCNLRDVTRSLNNKNTRLRHDNKSGVPGVHWHKRDKKWGVFINHNLKRKHLGNYDSLDEAVNVRKKAELSCEFHENHGSVRPL